MQIKPVLAALRRHRTATVLISLQVALTLAIISNALFIARGRVAHLARPTGIDEANIAVIHNQWIGHHETGETNTAMLRDLAVLRQLPGVLDAYADYSYPAAGPMAQLLTIGVQPAQLHPTSLAESYDADEHTLAALGLKLVAGRNFRAEEVGVIGADAAQRSPSVVIITRDLANALFPRDSALGRTIYIGDKPSSIIGVIANLQVPAVNTDSFAFRSVLLPYRLAAADGTYYLIRARPGQLDAVIRAAPKALLAADRMRVIGPGGAERYGDLRAAAYARDRGMATLMSLICIVLLAATAGGIVGLTSFWVAQRRKQIGVRRALGATRGDILRYFQTENFLIVTFGIVLGMVLTYAINLLLMMHYELPRLPFFYLPIGAVALWVLGQLAVLAPALRAAAVPPVVATRTV